MPTIHPTAIVEGPVELADDVEIGPYSVIRATPAAPVRIGARTRLLGQCWLVGPLTVGMDNTLHPFVTLGFPPQDLKWKPEEPGAGLLIGDGNVFRESVTIHRATSHETPTRIGDGNYFMVGSHAGHDCRIGNHSIFANAVLLGGHVQVGDRVIFGGSCAVHQFARVGRGCMLSGTMGLGRDLPPFFTLTGTNIAGSINLIGLRRSGADVATIDAVRWVYRVLYRSGQSPKVALATLRERADTPIVREYIEFVEQSRRGICPAHGSGKRGVAGLAEDGP